MTGLMAGLATGVLVCVKRVPDRTEEVVLADDGQSVDGRRSGYTLSAHEECAIELAVRIAGDGGEATAVTLGDAEAVEQLRLALAVGCTAATHVLAEAHTFGPADVARELAAVVRDHEAAGRPHDLVLLGNDAADSGDFQVGIRLAYELGRPVVNGASTVSVEESDDGPVVLARVQGPDGTGDLPRAPAGGGDGAGRRRRARLPDGARPDQGQEGADRGAAAGGRAERSGPGAADPAAAAAERRTDPRRGAGGRPGRGRRPRGAGSAEPMILVFVETDLEGAAVEVSLEAVTFARDLSAAGSGVPVDAVVVGTVSDALRTELATYGVRTVHRVGGAAVEAFSGAGWASAVLTVFEAAGSVVVMAAGTDRGNEVAAHIAARAAVPMAANVLAFSGLSPFVVTRQVVGGSVLEEMRLHQRPAVFTVAGHAVEAQPAAAPGAAELVDHEPEIAAADLVARVVSTDEPEADLSGALSSAKVVVGAGRGVGGADRFDDVLELTELLGGTLGVSRVVTSAGLASPPRAGRPDRQPHLARPLHPLRHQRGDPALGRAARRPRRSWPSTPTRRRRW